MGRGNCTFRQTDITRAIKAARAAGMDVAGVRVDPQTGVIEVVSRTSPVQSSEAAFDQWMATHARTDEGR
jgi:hypothetical protein